MSTLMPVFRWGRSFPACPSPVKARRPFTLNPGCAARELLAARCRNFPASVQAQKTRQLRAKKKAGQLARALGTAF